MAACMEKVRLSVPDQCEEGQRRLADPAFFEEQEDWRTAPMKRKKKLQEESTQKCAQQFRGWLCGTGDEKGAPRPSLIDEEHKHEEQVQDESLRLQSKVKEESSDLFKQVGWEVSRQIPQSKQQGSDYRPPQEQRSLVQRQQSERPSWPMQQSCVQPSPIKEEDFPFADLEFCDEDWGFHENVRQDFDAVGEGDAARASVTKEDGADDEVESNAADMPNTKGEAVLAAETQTIKQEAFDL